jgi:hypothetical protein
MTGMPPYLVRDRDRVYGRAVNEKLASLNVQQDGLMKSWSFHNSVLPTGTDARITASLGRACHRIGAPPRRSGSVDGHFQATLLFFQCANRRAQHATKVTLVSAKDREDLL